MLCHAFLILLPSGSLFFLQAAPQSSSSKSLLPLHLQKYAVDVSVITNQNVFSLLSLSCFLQPLCCSHFSPVVLKLLLASEFALKRYVQYMHAVSLVKYSIAKQTNPPLACLLLHCNHQIKAGNMSSWWGPTWISVRCRGKGEWMSSPVGSAQTQRRAQMRPPTPATPKHPCQVKTTPSDPADRQPACQLLRTASHAPSKATTFLSAFVV